MKNSSRLNNRKKFRFTLGIEVTRYLYFQINRTGKYQFNYNRFFQNFGKLSKSIAMIFINHGFTFFLRSDSSITFISTIGENPINSTFGYWKMIKRVSKVSLKYNVSYQDFTFEEYRWHCFTGFQFFENPYNIKKEIIYYYSQIYSQKMP